MLTNAMQMQERFFADADTMVVKVHVCPLSWSSSVAEPLPYNRLICDVGHDLSQDEFIQ